MTAVGHLSSAFLIKSKFKEVPFWTLLFASEAVELVWFILNLNLIGLNEPLEITKINLPFLYIGDMLLVQHIVSHSLMGAILIGLITSLILKFWVKSRGIFLAISLAVTGHWFLDLLVHDADLPVFISLDSVKLGPLFNFDSSHPDLGLSTTAPILGFLLQFAFSILSAFLFLRSFPIQDKKKKIKFWVLILLVNLSILGMFIKGNMTWLIKTPTIMVIMVLVDIITTGIMLYIAYRFTESNNVSLPTLKIS